MKKKIFALGLFAVASLGTVFAQTQIACSDLITEFFFDSNVNDEKGHGMVLERVNGSAVATTPYQGGEAIEASKGNPYEINIKRRVGTEVYDYSLPTGKGRRTLSLWINFDNANSGTTLFNWGSDGAKQQFGAYPSNITNDTYKLNFWGYGSGNDFTVDNPITRFDWHHVVFTYDGAAIRVYIDGVLEHTQTNELATGAGGVFKVGDFDGAFDDLRIYRRDLTDAEVTALFNGFQVDDCGAIGNLNDPYEECSDVFLRFHFNEGTHNNEGAFMFVENTANSSELLIEDNTVFGGKAIKTESGKEKLIRTRKFVPGQGIVAADIPNANSPRTVAFRFLTNGHLSSGASFFHYGANAQSMTFGAYPTGYDAGDGSYKITFQGFQDDYTVSNYLIMAGYWTHIAITYDSENVKIYVDGQLKGTTTKSLNTNQNSQFYFGNFDGWMDDLVIYNRELSSAEVLTLAQNHEYDDCFELEEEDTQDVCDQLIAKFYFGDNGLLDEENQIMEVQRSQGSNTISISNLDDNWGAIETSFDDSYKINIKTIDENDDVVNYNLPSGAQTRTVAMYVKMTEENNESGVFFFRYGENGPKKVFGAYPIFVGDDEFQFYFQGFGAGNDVGTLSTYQLNEYYHLAVTFNGARAKVYIDGELKASLEVTLETPVVNEFNFGNFDGYVSGLRIYDVALTADEISELADNGKSNGIECSGTDVEVPTPTPGEETSIGLNELNTLSFYPNPSNHIVYVEGVSNSTSFTIVDLTGQIAMSGTVNQTENTIDVSRLSAGVYMVQFENQRSQKLIINK